MNLLSFVILFYFRKKGGLASRLIIGKSREAEASMPKGLYIY